MAGRAVRSSRPLTQVTVAGRRRGSPRSRSSTYILRPVEGDIRPQSKSTRAPTTLANDVDGEDIEPQEFHAARKSDMLRIRRCRGPQDPTGARAESVKLPRQIDPGELVNRAW